MASERDASHESSEVRRVIARVDLEVKADRPPSVKRPRSQEEACEPHRHRDRADPSSSEFLRLRVTLSADLRDGRRVQTGRRDFGIAGPRRGVGAIWHRYHGPKLAGDRREQADILNRTYCVSRPDVEDAINRMLGRDPEQHRPPRLAWANLIDALASAEVDVSEEALIRAPLSVHLAPEVQSELVEL